jgi:hypothetical protein
MVKKTPKKSSSKGAKPKSRKTAVSKTAPRAEKQPIASRVRIYNLTREVPREKYFILANGHPVKNVAELASLLDQLEDHVFNHHVRPDKNDFHNWVKDVFEDVELARKITGVDDKRHLQLVIYRHMAGHD